MTRFRHDLILRMIKLLDAVLVTIPFAMCWYLYYVSCSFGGSRLSCPRSMT